MLLRPFGRHGHRSLSSSKQPIIATWLAGWVAAQQAETRKHLRDSKKVEQMNTQGALVFTLVPVVGVLLTALLALHYTKDPILRTAAKVALSLTGVLIIGLTLSVGGIVFGTHLLSWVL